MTRRRVMSISIAGIAVGAVLVAVAHSLPGLGRPSAAPHDSSADVRSDPPAERARAGADRGRFLDFAVTPPRRPGNTLMRIGTAGLSAQGRRIGMRQYGDPALRGEVLVFGCIHGDECAAAGIRPVVPGSGCPDPYSDVYLVPNLNPDGFESGTRLNGRGVDLNRNFPSDWRPIGERGSAQHSGPQPLSEPESRLAARMVRRLRPEVTIWFHQHAAPQPLVRAWGGSVPAARRFASLARLPFKRLQWLDGTAPNWQNHTFPGTASFVVELPPGPLSDDAEFRLGGAVVRLGRRLSED